MKSTTWPQTGPALRVLYCQCLLFRCLGRALLRRRETCASAQEPYSCGQLTSMATGDHGDDGHLRICPLQRASLGALILAAPAGVRLATPETGRTRSVAAVFISDEGSATGGTVGLPASQKRAIAAAQEWWGAMLDSRSDAKEDYIATFIFITRRSTACVSSHSRW
jgi:hypothetical protein